MPPKKRRGSPWYWYDFTVNGTRFRGSTETDDFEAAKTIEAKLRTDAVIGQHFGGKPRMTLDTAMGKYWQDHGQYLSSAWSAVDISSRVLLDVLGPDTYLDEINDPEVDKVTASMVGKVSNATINRRLDHLQAVMNKARKKWGVRVSDVEIRRHMLLIPEARTRWISPEDADRLIECAVEHLKAPIRFALLTGARLANIIGLKWEDVSLQPPRPILRLRGVKSKLPGGKTIELPIGDMLFSLLVEQGPRKSGYVFLRRFKPDKKTGKVRPPEPIKKFRRSFGTACKAAGIENFRFHDLRHTAASWMIQNKVPLDVVQSVLGHSHISMTQKYAHRDVTAKADALNSLSASHIRHTDQQEKIA